MEDGTFEVPHPCDHGRPFLLFVDPVHVFKSIWKNWVTAGNLHYLQNHVAEETTLLVAKRSHLTHVCSPEKQSSLKFTSVTSRALNPSNLERQDVTTAMKAFDNKTADELDLLAKNREDINSCGYQETTAFIRKVILWFVPLNARRCGLDDRLWLHHTSTYSGVFDERWAIFGQYGNCSDTWELAIIKEPKNWSNDSNI